MADSKSGGKKAKKSERDKGKWLRNRNNKVREISNLKHILQSCGEREAVKYAAAKEIPGTLQRLLAKRKTSKRPDRNTHKARGNPANRIPPRTPFKRAATA